MKRLNQVLATESTVKTKSENTFTKVYQDVQKADLVAGLTRTYTPKVDEGEKLPAERKVVQLRVRDAVKQAKEALAELFDTTAMKDATNTTAKADVVVDGQTVLTGVPAVHLLFLEKKMTSVIEFIKKLPTLSTDEEWGVDTGTGLAVSQPVETIRQLKVEEHQVIVPATDKHPAQVAKLTKDVIVGTWRLVKYSGALPVDERNALLSRAEKLQKAVKAARQEANEAPVVNLSTSAALSYVFEGR
jgi:hypothetical protein